MVFGTSTGNEAGAELGDEEFWIDTDLDREVDAGEIITGATTTLDGDAVVAASPNRCEDGYVWLNQRVNEGDEPVADECIAPQLDENSDISRVDFTGESCPTGTQKRDENEDGNTDDGECHIPALFVQSDGDVGVGTTSPGAELHIKDSAPRLRLEAEGTGAAANAYIEFNETDARKAWIGFGSTSNNDLTIYQENTDSDVVIPRGNVGIGTTGPTTRLEVLSGTNTDENFNKALTVGTSTGGGQGGWIGSRTASANQNQGLMLSSSQTLTLHGDNAGDGYSVLDILGGSNPDIPGDTSLLMRVNSDGNVGIGTSSPGTQYKLEVAGGDITNHPSHSHPSCETSWDCISTYVFTGNYYYGSDSGSTIYVGESGNTVSVRGTFSQASDARLKEGVTTLSSALENILSLRGVSYYRNDRQDTSERVGLIAQEVEAIYPQLVSTNEEGYKAVAYSRLVSPLIEAVKQLHALYQGHADRIALLEAQLQERDAELEAQNAELENHIAHQDERIAHQDELIVQLEVRLAALEAAQ